MGKIASAVVILMIMLSAQSRAEGINSLVEVGKSMADINAAQQEETRSFDRVNAAVKSGAIRKGIAKESIRAQYGEPVISNEDAATKREKWVYIPATSSFFEGEKIYLFFDNTGKVDEIRLTK